MQELLERASQLHQLIRAARDETEHQRRLAPDVVRALAEVGLFQLAVPEADGGLEAPPAAALAVFEELASAEASAAWIVWNATLPALMSKFLDAPVRRELFSDRRTLIANSTRPTGRARPHAHGFVIDGRWSLVSGCELASHLLLRCVVSEPAQRAPYPPTIMAYLPRARCEIVDTWQAGGLRGTGSHDVVVRALDVPAAHCVSFQHARRLDTPLYRMPFAATLSAGCAAVCLGSARAAVEALLELVRDKQPADGVAPRERPALQVEVVQLTTERSAARHWLLHVIEDTWRTCAEGRAPTPPDAAQVWGAARHAAHVSREIVRRAYAAAGASALSTQCVLERAHRDVHAATQHIILADSWTEDAGRVLLGQEPSHPLFAT
jgi:indole-3-acetate monooxygenase